MPDLNLDTLNCVYMVLFFIGVGYALFIVITGGLSDIDLPDVDIDIPQVDLPGDVDIPGADIHIGDAGTAGGIDAPDVSVSPLSPITIATFITTFGGLGVLSTQLFGLDPRIGLLVATGGGLFLNASNRRVIRRTGSSVWLDVSLDLLRGRLGTGEGRPLWISGDPVSMRALFERRRSTYALADHRVDADAGTPREIALRAIGGLRQIRENPH